MRVPVRVCCQNSTALVSGRPHGPHREVENEVENEVVLILHRLQRRCHVHL